MEDDPHSDEEILEILKMKKVAVVGMSKTLIRLHITSQNIYMIMDMISLL